MPPFVHDELEGVAKQAWPELPCHGVFGGDDGDPARNGDVCDHEMLAGGVPKPWNWAGDIV